LSAKKRAGWQKIKSNNNEWGTLSPQTMPAIIRKFKIKSKQFLANAGTY
jgi:hypothetical protein